MSPTSACVPVYPVYLLYFIVKQLTPSLRLPRPAPPARTRVLHDAVALVAATHQRTTRAETARESEGAGFGIGAFLFALRVASNPMGPQPGWAMPIGIVCLIAGLTAASLVIWRWR